MALTYNAWLVGGSIALAAFDAYVAFSVVGRIARTRGPAALLWTVAGALATGSGVWAMHFTGLLAARTGTPLGYGIGLTLLSMLPIVLAAAAVLWLVARHTRAAPAIWLPGAVLGAGLAGMHCLGLLALRMQPGFAWNGRLATLALLLGMLGPVAGLWLNARSRRGRRPSSRLWAVGLIGGGIAAAHYLGTAAAGLPDGAVSLAAFSGLHGSALGLAVSLASGLLLLLTLCASLAHRRMERHADDIHRELRAARDALAHQAFHDALTRLPNRANVLDLLQRLLPQAQRERFEVAVMFIDLDGFKSINDTLGHEAGDQFLRSVASALCAAVRPRDTVARFGGDEFVIVLERYRSEANLIIICEKILALVGRPVQVAEHNVTATPSIGVAMFPRDGEDAASLLRHADLAMYAAKEQGKAGYCFYQQRMTEEARHRLVLSAELREALQHGEILVHYQPKVDLRTRRLVGLEALARWAHPQRGLLLPKSFVPLAETSGLIARLGSVILRQVVQQITQWRAQALPLVPVAINVSPQEIQDSHFAESLLRTMAALDLPHEAIEFEITESAAMKNAEHTLRQLRQLETLGFHMAIDDFGTGFSSLSHLRHLPARSIKIDQSFVQGAGLSQEDRDITEAIIALARRLRLQTIAEGIETEEQVEWLQRAGCDVGQGYLFMPPLPPERVPALLAGEFVSAAEDVR
ncbi:EAL domain-containing protein [Frateuria sp. Soil773]|uniref:putative bifunctional diguanylate cyclase/phosphodiesterase n=1 Tax=Frateuria sp. Soil773 TaxID=1736407 RepID=UPI00138F69F1|nr:EAL domain-containing protein [Frateuria sp. Soil773]